MLFRKLLPKLSKKKKWELRRAPAQILVKKNSFKRQARFYSQPRKPDSVNIDVHLTLAWKNRKKKKVIQRRLYLIWLPKLRWPSTKGGKRLLRLDLKTNLTILMKARTMIEPPAADPFNELWNRPKARFFYIPWQFKQVSRQVKNNHIQVDYRPGNLLNFLPINIIFEAQYHFN